jgi:hypothetical protein
VHYTDLEQVIWSYSNELDVTIGTNDHLPCNDLADVVYAKLEPGQTLRLHRHERLRDGYEAFFFFQGASIRVILDNEEHREICNDEPFHLTFYGDEAHGVSNLAETPVLFEVLCTPRHVPGEESITC